MDQTKAGEQQDRRDKARWQHRPARMPPNKASREEGRDQPDEADRSGDRYTGAHRDTGRDDDGGGKSAGRMTEGRGDILAQREQVERMAEAEKGGASFKPFYLNSADSVYVTLNGYC